jgi:ATP-binding cassette subfamily F protein 3
MDRPAPEPRAERPKKPSREALLRLRQDVRKCEERIEKLQVMEQKVADKLADPAIYDDIHGLTEWQKKYAEIENGLALAEQLWLEAQERLEAAESA